MTPSHTTRKPVVLVPACNRHAGPPPLPHRRQEVHRRRAPGRLPAAGGAERAGRRDRRAARPGRRRAADRLAVERAPAPFRRGRARPRACRWTRSATHWTLPLDPAGCWRAACRCSPSAAARRKPTWRSAASLHQAVQEVPGYARPPRRRRRPAPRCSTAWRTRSTCSPAACWRASWPRALRGELGARPGREPAGAGLARRSAGARRARRGLLHARGARASTCACNGIPSGRPRSNPVSVQLLRAFGEACRAYRDRSTASRCPSARPAPQTTGSLGGAPQQPPRSDNSFRCPMVDKRQFHLQRTRTVAQRAPRDRDRVPGARPHRRGARQDPAAREVHRRPRHAAARGRGGHGRDRRVPRGRAVLRRHQPDRPRHAPAARPDARCASCPGPPTRRRR